MSCAVAPTSSSRAAGVRSHPCSQGDNMAVDVDALERVVSEVVSPNAGAVDANGEFPVKSLDALQAMGLIGLTTSSDAGGGGGPIAAAATARGEVAGAWGPAAGGRP